MSDFNSQVQVDLRGNLTAASKNMARAVSGLASSASRSFGRLNKAAVGVSNGIDRVGNKYTGLATGFATGALARGVINFGAILKDIQVQAGMTGDEAETLKQKLYDIANDEAVRVNPQELIAGLSTFIDLTGDMKYAEENLRNIGLAMRASSADSTAIAQTMNALRDIGISGSEDVKRAFELLIEQGKKGSVPFKEMANEIGPLATQMQNLGYSGQEALNFLGAFFMTARKGTGSTAEAATAIEGFFNALKSKGELLNAGGIKLFDAEGNSRDLDLILQDTFTALEKIKDPIKRNAKVYEIFGETGGKAIAKLQSDFAKTGKMTMLDDLMSVEATGNQIEQDAIDKTRSMAAAIETLNAGLSRMADDNLSEPIQELADAISGLSSEELENLFDIAATGVAVAGGIWAVNKAIRGTAAGVRLVQGLRGGTRAGGRAAGALASATATPVMVTNWPVGRGGGGYGYGADGGGNGKNGKSRSPRMRARGRFGGLISMGAKASAATGLTSIGSKAGKFVRGAGPLATGLAVMNIGSAAVQGDGRGVAGATGSLGGALVGGKLGALGGSLAGPIGTAVGGVIGAGLGAYLGEEAITSLWDSLFSKENSQNSGNNEALERNNALLERQASAIEENTRVQGVMGRRQRRQQQRGDAAGVLEGGQP